MTVMLLQPSVTPQLTHNLKSVENNNSTDPPYVFLLDIQEHIENNNSTNYDSYNNNYNINNNNNINNIHNNEKTSRKNIAVIGRGSTCGSTSVGGAASTKSSQARFLTTQGKIAMRYYRLWIYTCNIVLLGSAAGFAAAVSRTLLFSTDPRRYLVPGLPKAYDPTALYGYLALATQLGVVQLLGCVAARRLSAKLLNAYWVLLLALLFGDAVMGVAWVFRFEKIRAELRPNLRLRLQQEYSKEPRFSEQWDQLQQEFSCCGVTGPRDFGTRWPQTCCNPNSNVSSTNGTASPCQSPYAYGCEEPLLRWLRKTADLLFVLGFCVIAFAKLCFLGILRYEIREMIQKIRLLREPPPPPMSLIQSFCTPAQPINPTINNGSMLRRTTLPIVTVPANVSTQTGNTSLLLPVDDYVGSRHPLLASTVQDAGADSDTNSHCALILEESTPPLNNHNNGTSREKSNGNNNYEMREFNRRLLLPNGNPASPGVTNGTQSKHT